MMTRLVSLFAVCALVACGGAPPAADPPTGEETTTSVDASTGPAAGVGTAGGDADNGAEIYGRICSACHGPDGDGMNGMLAASFINDKTRLQKPDVELLKSINEGFQGKIGVMPAQKGMLTDEEQRDALAYIRASFGK